MDHPDQEVQKAIVRLNDALCMWERNTFRQSILIIREQGGFVYRSVSGKPIGMAGVTDLELVAYILPAEKGKRGTPVNLDREVLDKLNTWTLTEVGMTNWISVKEQTPPHNEPIVYCMPSKHGSTKFHVGIANWTVSEKWLPDMYSEKYKDGFTHWMILPDKPQHP